MGATDLNISNQFTTNAYNTYETMSNNNPTYSTTKVKSDEAIAQENKIHNSAVNVSISMQSLELYLNIKSAEFSQQNSTSQSSLMNIINNVEVYDFLSGKENQSGFSLQSIGYDGKPITELTVDEAKDLVSENGFFGVNETSARVSGFVMNLAGNNVASLQEARKGVVQGFEDAEKMWGGELPEISYETQKQTLKVIDEKIDELLKTDSQKELDSTKE